MGSAFNFLTILGFIVVFALPLTCMLPNFNIWYVIPKISITRLHLISYTGTWSQLNGTILSAVTLLFCLYLEIRKRRLVDLVISVVEINQATDATMKVQRRKQTSSIKSCMEMLETSSENYENLMLLRDDLKKRNKLNVKSSETVH